MGAAPDASSAMFARLLRDARLRAELTQAMLAEKAGMSTRAVQHLEAGRGQPYAHTATRLADALGLRGDARQAFEDSARRVPKPRTRSAPRPTVRADDSRARGLPRMPTSFIGREREIRELRQQLNTARLVTVTGAGGAGKTRLAIEVAHAELQLKAGDDDGLVFVDLAPLTDPALVPLQVAACVCVTEVPRVPITQTLVDVLRERHTLIVLDNCEHLLPACADLVDVLLRNCAHVRILATSRSRLGLADEHVWRVPPL